MESRMSKIRGAILLLALKYNSGVGALAFQPQSPQSRRNAIDNICTSIVGTAGVISTFPNEANAATATATAKNELGAQSDSYSVYQIMTDASEKLSPYIKPIEPANFVKSSLKNNNGGGVKGGGVVWLGEHHNSARDHKLQAHFIESIYNQRTQTQTRTGKNKKNKGQEQEQDHKMSIGLEQIQVQFQPALDAFIAGTISEEQMLEETHWSTRWTWPYENYRPVFALAQKLKIPLIALNVNSEDLAKVEVDGFRGLDRPTMKKYIKDPVGFSNFPRPPAYRTYSAYVIEPSYDLHKEMGILKTTISGQQLENDMTFGNFFSGRILWDEAMAGNAFQWTKENEGGMMVGLIGADHVKFEKGVVGRYRRLMNYEASKHSDISADNARVSEMNSLMNVAVLLNPTLIDSRPSGSANAYMNAASSAYPDRITLQLRYLKDDVPPSSEDRELPSSTGGVLPLADYIVISNQNTA